MANDAGDRVLEPALRGNVAELRAELQALAKFGAFLHDLTPAEKDALARGFVRCFGWGLPARPDVIGIPSSGAGNETESLKTG
jgi:hypothetical protein